MTKHPLPIEPGTLKERTFVGVDKASGRDSTALFCRSCYRVDCEHIENLKRIAEKNAAPKRFIVDEFADLDPPSYLPMREHEAPRVPDLCPDTTVVPFFPNGAISAIFAACSDAGVPRPNAVRVEWNAEHASVVAYVDGIWQDDCDMIMTHAFKYMPLEIGLEVHVETKTP